MHYSGVMMRLTLRLPDEIHEAVEAASAADRRSINSMLIVLIEESLRARAELGARSDS